MTVRTVMRREERRLVIDIQFKNSDGTSGRYRHDAEVQTLAAARAEERRRLVALATTGSPYSLVTGAVSETSTAAGSSPVLIVPTSKAPIFKDVAADYLKVFAPSHLKPSTIHGYTALLKALLVPRFGEMPIDTIMASHIRTLDAELVGRKARPSTRRQAQAVVRSVLCRYAVEAELLPAPGPVFPALPRSGATIKQVLTFAQVQAILAASAPRLRRAFMLAAYAGLRAGEVRGLRWRDIDLDAGRLVVRRSICRGEEAPPKSGHERIVPLVPDLKQELETTTTRGRDAPVAPSGTGEVWSEFALTTGFKRVCKKAQIDSEWRLHDLRHAFVTMLFRSGASAPTVRALAGHANLSTTQRYAHVVEIDLDRAIERLGAMAK